VAKPDKPIGLLPDLGALLFFGGLIWRWLRGRRAEKK
jgi:hypothetical protein